MPCKDGGPPRDYYTEGQAIQFIELIENRSYTQDPDMKGWANFDATKKLCSLCKMIEEQKMQSYKILVMLKNYNLKEWYECHLKKDLESCKSRDENYKEILRELLRIS